MSRKVIAFFSSDARELYKADVFRTLALPKKYVIHFRYQSKYLQSEVLAKLESLINREGVIFYARGNDTKVDEEKRVITIHAIRNVVIKDIYRDTNLDLINFTLELGDFSDCMPLGNTAKELLPPHGIVSEINVEEGKNNTWVERVSSVKDDFKETLFYFINSITNNHDDELQPKYSNISKESYYELTDESEYQIHISFYDPSDGKNGLQVENSSNLVSLDIPSEYRIGAPRDTKVFKIYTQALSKQRSRCYSKLSVRTQNNQTPTVDLSIRLHWDVIRTNARTLLFGLFSLVTAIGFWGINIAFKPSTEISLTCLNWLAAIISLLFFGVGTGFLYWMFNKK